MLLSRILTYANRWVTVDSDPLGFDETASDDAYSGQLGLEVEMTPAVSLSGTFAFAFESSDTAFVLGLNFRPGPTSTAKVQPVDIPTRPARGFSPPPHKTTKMTLDNNSNSVIEVIGTKNSRIGRLPELTPAKEKKGLDTKSSRISRLAEPAPVKEKKKRVQSPAKRSVHELLGGYIVAEDGQFLGRISTNEAESLSILNEVGKYGSEVSNTSIFNDVGQYGSSVSPQSAFNDIASTPPRMYTAEGEFVAYLTTNTVKGPRVNTRAFIGWLKSQK